MPRPSPKVDKSVSIVSKTMQGLGTRLNVLEWGQMTFEDIKQTIDIVYSELVFWRRNLFMLPTGAAGK